MPSANDLKQFQRVQKSAGTDDTAKLVANLPPVPDEVKQRFPSMARWESDQKDWIKQLIIALRGGQASS